MRVRIRFIPRPRRVWVGVSWHHWGLCSAPRGDPTPCAASQGFYKRTPDYVQIREWKHTGCFPVPMVHSTFLVDLRKEASSKLAFYPPHPDYAWTFDDIIVFAFSSRQAGTARGATLGQRRQQFNQRNHPVLGGLGAPDCLQ